MSTEPTSADEDAELVERLIASADDDLTERLVADLDAHPDHPSSIPTVAGSTSRFEAPPVEG